MKDEEKKKLENLRLKNSIGWPRPEFDQLRDSTKRMTSKVDLSIATRYMQQVAIQSNNKNADVDIYRVEKQANNYDAIFKLCADTQNGKI